MNRCLVLALVVLLVSAGVNELNGQCCNYGTLLKEGNKVIAKNDKTALNLMYTVHFVRLTGIFIVNCCCFSLEDYFIILKGLMFMIHQICSHLILSGICLKKCLQSDTEVTHFLQDSYFGLAV